MKIHPLQDRILVRRDEGEETTPSGIIIPDTAKEKPVRGQVVAAGEGKKLDDGSSRRLEVSLGDHVIFGRYAGTEVSVDGEELLIMREDDVLGIVD